MLDKYRNFLAMKRIIAFLILAFLVSGCAIIVNEDNSIRHYGINGQDAASLMQKISDKQQEIYKVGSPSR